MGPGVNAPGISFNILSGHRTKWVVKGIWKTCSFTHDSFDSILIVPNRLIGMNFMHKACSE